MRHLQLALLTLLLIAPAARHAEASFTPTSVSLGLGYSNGLGPESNSYTPVPSVSALWPLVNHVSVFSALSYLQERSAQQNFGLPATGYPYLRPESVTRRSHFVPITMGLRVSAGSAARSHGLFIEAGPAAYVASLDEEQVEVLPGFQAGAGVRFHAFGASHGEIGMSHYRSGKPDTPEESWSTSSDREGVNAYALYATIGLNL